MSDPRFPLAPASGQRTVVDMRGAWVGTPTSRLVFEWVRAPSGQQTESTGSWQVRTEEITMLRTQLATVTARLDQCIADGRRMAEYLEVAEAQILEEQRETQVLATEWVARRDAMIALHTRDLARAEARAERAESTLTAADQEIAERLIAAEARRVRAHAKILADLYEIWDRPLSDRSAALFAIYFEDARKKLLAPPPDPDTEPT